MHTSCFPLVLLKKGLLPLVLVMVCSMTGFFSFGQQSDVFGKKENSGNGLIGIIYDLKQDQKHNPTGVTPQNYVPIVSEFLDKGWDESVLNLYFRAARPLYTTQIFIPMMSAGEAPKAFEMEKVIAPSAWLVHYKGQVTPPDTGTYRFITYADDVIAVAVNGSTVCVGNHASARFSNWKSPETAKAGRAGNGELVYGEWVQMKKNEPFDLDVIVGERPGGEFCAFLLYEKQGAVYSSEDAPKRYPIFKLAQIETPEYQPDSAPIFFKTPEVWGLCQ